MTTVGHPFIEPSSLPFQLPDFAAITTADYRPAFADGMARHRAELEAIASDPQPPDFENTVVALERSGSVLTRTMATFENVLLAMGGTELEAIEADLAPNLAAHWDAVHLDRRLFERLDVVHSARHDPAAALAPEEVRLIERHHRTWVRAGAGLGPAQQERLKQINAELAGLQAAFVRKMVADSADLAVHVQDVADLDGLAAGQVTAAAQAAAARGLTGYLLTLGLPTNQPVLEDLNRREVRERVFNASISRGLRGNENDTRADLVAIVRLRAERSELLGFDTFADYVVAEGTAKTLAAVDDMIAPMVPAAMANADAEAADLQAALIADGLNGPLQPWDWAYYARRLRDARFDLDTAALRPYFALNQVLHDGVFFAAQELYGLSFVVRDDLHGYADDVQVYEVRGADGEPIGLFIADWYARDTKRGGAWMSSFRDQSELLDAAPVIVINLNLTRPAPGEPTLLTLDEVDTAFHEFGHVLHGLLSAVRYPTQSGTNVPNDFVEFPSQVNEMWALWPQLLARYARHHLSGQPLPPQWAASVKEAASFGQGFATTEYLAAALLDLAYHRLDGASAAALTAAEVEQFEAAALAQAGLAHPLIPPRYRSTYFQHIFGGMYGANYYAYLWSEVLDADTVDWFTERGGLLRANGQIFADELLSRGDARDPMEAFVAVRGRPPAIEPLLRRRHLTPA